MYKRQVVNLSGGGFIEREMALFKISVPDATAQAQIIQFAEIFEGKVIYVDKHQLGIEISGRSDKIDYFMMLVKDFGILEMARSGRVAISKKSPEEI